MKIQVTVPQATRKGDQDIIDNWLQLTENHSDLNAYDEEGFTALHLAVKKKHGSIFKRLLDSGAGIVLDLANWYSTCNNIKNRKGYDRRSCARM